MLVIEVELLLGTFRGAGPEDLALTVGDVAAEWPPSPARLYSALVGGGGTRDRQVPGCDVGALRVLEDAPPLIRADRAGNCLFTPLLHRFVVENEAAVGAVQDYPARVAQPVRPGGRVAPMHPHVAYIWPHVEADQAALTALRLRAARVGYLGCADSPVRVRVHTTVPAHLDALDRWTPTEVTGDAVEAVAVPFPGIVDVLDRIFDAFAAGEVPRRSWYRVEQAWYLAPGEPAAVISAGRQSIWFRLGRPVSARATVALTEALRGALLKQFDEMSGGTGDLPTVLHGHGGEPEGHAQFLALPHVGFDYADGRHRGLAISFPSGTDPRVVALSRVAAGRIDRLHGRGVDVSVTVHDGSARPLAARPDRWRGPSRRWASVLPVVHERYTRRRDPSLAELASWCSYAGLPQPVRARTSPVAFVSGAPTLPAAATTRAGERSRPFSHVEIEFAEPVTGPVAFGRMRHFGLGLLLPLDGESADG